MIKKKERLGRNVETEEISQYMEWNQIFAKIAFLIKLGETYQIINEHKKLNFQASGP